MRSLSSVGLGLSIVFGCLLLALVAELYYLLWWKKRLTSTEMEDDYSSPARELLYMYCWKKPSSLSSRALNPQELCSSDRVTDTHVLEPHQAHHQLHMHGKEDYLLKPFGEETMETELMRLHDLSGPPRFLFTIKEETKEDLESEDGKSRGDKSAKGSRSRSLSDLLLTVETPFLTPLASPPFFTPPLTPMDSSYNHQGVNPLFESAADADQFSKISSSPPPKFKFLKDAEEKLHRKVMEEAKKEQLQFEVSADFAVNPPSSSKLHKDEEDGSFITIVVAKNKEKDLTHHSSSSQILPLVSSPSTFDPPASKKPILHHSFTN
ncbi:hypothetical protein VitviT2T_017723 [Vitis vinifera]|uniref:Uncharacterized protein n=2 Tax=Vitis vinifera TaxID=29760 RepID=F6HI80_VITVI|nr:uncharacterized protein LOC100249867 [Vitis vinifera]RVX20317.1 hypothetical protein CK203_004451 [Vitis vinifera]WJZ99264.1 hypothetical protein VitviT2T_017723 [Vitis vinifera]|eukprot:XP_003633292.1 PREDICTED: uncharacterized protein LOC100249867 [Vitis vinifera]